MFFMELWSNQNEIDFFKSALHDFLEPEKLFYKIGGTYYAYVPKSIQPLNQTLQSRNSLIGFYTENYCKKLLHPIAEKLNLYAVSGVRCESLSLTKQSPGDLALCTTDNKEQNAENIKLLIEIKMSIISNYTYLDGNLKFEGDFTSHRGVPSILRSDSVLKAIGKSVNIRVSGKTSRKIPILILGNSPITQNYTSKIDYLVNSGIIQGVFSINPKPTEKQHITQSPKLGFCTIKSLGDLFKIIQSLIFNEQDYFSCMLPKLKLGQIIELSNKELTFEAKAEKFLSLIYNQ